MFNKIVLAVLPFFFPAAAFLGTQAIADRAVTVTSATPYQFCTEDAFTISNASTIAQQPYVNGSEIYLNGLLGRNGYDYQINTAGTAYKILAPQNGMTVQVIVICNSNAVAVSNKR